MSSKHHYCSEYVNAGSKGDGDFLIVPRNGCSSDETIKSVKRKWGNRVKKVTVIHDGILVHF